MKALEKRESERARERERERERERDEPPKQAVKTTFSFPPPTTIPAAFTVKTSHPLLLFCLQPPRLDVASLLTVPANNPTNTPCMLRSAPRYGWPFLPKASN